MLSTQTTETTDPLSIPEDSMLDLLAPICKGAPTPTPTSAVPFLVTFATAISSTAGYPELTCDGSSVNCTDINDQRGATIVSPILLGLTGTIGQVWALVYLHCSTKRQNQRTVFYLLLCILIWTDFFGKLLTTPPAIISYSNRHWVGGKAMCDFHGFSMVFISLLTHFTVSAMAIERYLGICHGYFYSRNITPSKCKKIFFGIWLFCFVSSVLPLFSLGKFYLQYPGTWCFTNLHLCEETPIFQKIYTTTLGVLNVSNLLIIVVCNVFVVGSLLKMRITPHLAFQQGQPHRNRKKNEQELQMVIVLSVITCVFVVSWAPLDMILLANQAWPPHGAEDHFQELVAIRLCSLNQIVDPFAYIISRVVFRSRLWSCCRRAMMGRGWSRRGEGSHFPISSLLHTRKFSRTQSPPKDHIATVKEVNRQFPEEVETRPETEKTTRAPSLHKSYYSDSGTGSYSGVETPLVDKLEDPPFSPGALQPSKGTALQQSLAKTLSVAIPIPLFTSEQYRVAELGKEEVDGYTRDVYCLVDTARAPLRYRTDNCGNLTGCEDAGVFRSNSWGCQSMRPPQPQCRTQSTQTLSTGFGIYPDPSVFLKPTETQVDNRQSSQEPNGNITSEVTKPTFVAVDVDESTNGNVRQSSSLIHLQAGETVKVTDEATEEVTAEITAEATAVCVERGNKRPHSPETTDTKRLETSPASEKE